MSGLPAGESQAPGVGDLRGVRRLFLTLLGIVFAIAFASLGVQAEGLFGSDGILPGCPLLELVRERLGSAAYVRIPTLYWVHCSDAAIRAACTAGVLLSLLLCAGVMPSLVAGLLWLLYLSLSSIAGVFLGYQWDVLLLEAAFLAIFTAPRQLRPRDAWRTRVPRGAVWLYRWLVFRVFFLSGMVKLLSGDESWRNLSALQYHYFTQPLPAWTSWLAYQLPAPLHALTTGATLAIELGLPFAAFGPRRVRQVAFVGLVALQLGIGLTGNYGFFNLLTAALCLWLLDDAALRRALPVRWRSRRPPVPEPPPTRGRRLAYALLAVLVAGLGLASALERLGVPELPRPLAAAGRLAAPLRSFNAYGLFAVMTTQRPEIVLEGSRDGVHWQPYAFRWKPGDPKRAPRFAQPHMPRLDWQLWFAALSRCEPWFQRFMARLLEGAPAVRALLADDPFPGSPPRLLRSTVSLYRFAPPGSDAWWVRRELGPYCPTVTLEQGHLVPLPR